MGVSARVRVGVNPTSPQGFGLMGVGGSRPLGFVQQGIREEEQREIRRRIQAGDPDYLGKLQPLITPSQGRPVPDYLDDESMYRFLLETSQTPSGVPGSQKQQFAEMQQARGIVPEEARAQQQSELAQQLLGGIGAGVQAGGNLLRDYFPPNQGAAPAPSPVQPDYDRPLSVGTLRGSAPGRAYMMEYGKFGPEPEQEFSEGSIGAILQAVGGQFDTRDEFGRFLPKQQAAKNAALQQASATAVATSQQGREFDAIREYARSLLESPDAKITPRSQATTTLLGGNVQTVPPSQRALDVEAAQEDPNIYGEIFDEPGQVIKGESNAFVKSKGEKVGPNLEAALEEISKNPSLHTGLANVPITESDAEEKFVSILEESDVTENAARMAWRRSGRDRWLNRGKRDRRRGPIRRFSLQEALMGAQAGMY